MQNILANNKKSQELYNKACELIPGGVNSPVRSFKAVGLDPLFILKGKGPYIWDVNQNKHIDFVMSWGALIHGHLPDEVISQIERELLKGVSFGAPHENEIELAEIIIRNFPSIEKIRLMNSGTEAVMTAIRLARAYTRKNKVIKFDGCYHGHSDSVLSTCGSGTLTFGIPKSAGVLKSTASETITLPFNDIQTFEITLSKFPGEIACVIVEPVIGNCGVILPNETFLKSLRDLTIRYKCLLIFDEVITGFRLSSGGAQVLFNLKPDITTLGKIIGGGMPVGLVGGRKEIMDLLAPLGPVYQAGTLAGNPISVVCGIATLKLLLKEGMYQYLEYISSLLCNGMEKINKKKNIKVQVNRAGSMFNIFFNERSVTTCSQAKRSNTNAYSVFFQKMLSCGIYLAPSQFEANFISTAHKEDDIKRTLEAYENSIDNLQL